MSSEKQNCPICDWSVGTSVRLDESGSALVDCTRCGKFGLSAGARLTLHGLVQNSKNRPLISHAVRAAQTNSERPLFDSDTLRAISEKSLPLPKEQSDFLLRMIADQSQTPGEVVFLETLKVEAVIGASSARGVLFVLKHLTDEGLITTPGQSWDSVLDRPTGQDYKAQVWLTMKGWERIENIRRPGPYRKAFMAMKFQEPDLERLLKDHFKPAAKAAGFDLRKLDDEPQAGLIDNRLRVEIQTSDFLVADLTHDNNGAYWEAGYAEGLGKPVIYTCEKRKFDQRKSHFDTNHHFTILWDLSNAEQAATDLKATIRATLPNLAVLVDKE